jgi:pyruvate/2-oxoglutarate dehydrogenase complex dihydrolipoamide dehydrogenase (E3) component
MIDVDVLVVGGGAAGLTAAETARLLGLRVAMVEQDKLGGDCTWYGCVPSKTLLASAKLAHQARHAHQWGVRLASVEVDFAAVMARVRATIQHIYEEESPDVWRKRGIQVFIARAHFVNSHTMQLSTGEIITAKRIILATGARSILPEVFDDVPCLTHHTLFDLTEQPTHLLIVGGGAISVEMGQAFQRLGTQVTILTREARLLHTADNQASEFITQVLRDDGVGIVTEVDVTEATATATGVRLTLNNGQTVEGSHLLVAVGKRPDARGLSPEKAGLVHREGILQVSDTLQTAQPHIYAVGDLAGAPFYTHSAGSEATTAVLNALLPLKSKRKKIAPYTLFTSPELAQVGLAESEARRQYRDVRVTRLPFAANDRANTDGTPEGFVKVLHGKYGKVYGVTIVGNGAGELINEWAQVYDKGGRIYAPLLTTHVYPSLGYGNGLPGIEFLRELSEKTALGKLIQRVMRWLVRR